MNVRRYSPLFLFIAIMLVTGLACGGSVATSAPAATDTALPPATNTPRPTATPRPTKTPNLAATEQAEELQTLIQDFYDQGYVSSLEGEFTPLDDFFAEWPQIGWYQWWPSGDGYEDFVFKAHFNWSTASATPDESGCGIVFGIQENDDHYAVFLDRSRILFLMARGSNVYLVGKTRGPGRTNFGNPAEADFVVSVKGQSAYVQVEGEVTEYTLSADQPSAGEFGLTLLSGTNKDYGTRCEMTNVILWTPR